MQRMGLSMKVTAKCHKLCGEKCGVMAWMNNNPDYEMPMRDVITLVEHSMNANYRFEFIIFTGGEPFLWSNIVDAARLIRASKIAKVLTVYTNGMEVRKIRQLRDYFTHIKITKYPYNQDKIRELSDLPNLMVKTLHHFSQHPDCAVPDSLPADCACKAYSMFRDSVYLCSFEPVLYEQFPHLREDNGSRVQLQGNFLRSLQGKDPFNRPVCAHCFGNTKVKRQTGRIANA